MANYSELNYVVRNTDCDAQYELAYALTNKELVRRTTNRVTGIVIYQAVDLLQLTGNTMLSYDSPLNPTPGAKLELWTMLEGTDPIPYTT